MPLSPPAPIQKIFYHATKMLRFGFPKFGHKYLVKKCCRFYSPSAESVSQVPGYFVVLPEVPPATFNSSDNNEVLNYTTVPSTLQIDPKKVRDAIGILSLRFESKIWCVEHLLKDQNYQIEENLLKDLDTKEIDYAISLLNIVHILKNLSNYEGLLRRINMAVNRKYKSKHIYYSAKALLADHPRSSELKRIVQMGKLNGLELTPESQNAFETVIKKLEEQKQEFLNNVYDANSKFRHLIVDEKHLGAMNINEMADIAKDRENPKRGPWTVTLNKHVYTSFLENCPVPALRWNVWQAYSQRCTTGYKKNGGVIEYIRDYRKKLAQLLGYRNHSEFVLATKMATNPQNVKSMIVTLLSKAMPQQKEDIERIHKYSASRGYDTKLNQWDIPFWKKQEREELFNVSGFNFPYEQTFRSLLSFTSRLFGFEYKEVSENHYIVKRSGVEVGRFIVDPYKGKSKLPGSYVIRNQLFSTLILNFEPPLYGKESMLNSTEVTTLFENFGHLLQNCLNRNNEDIVSDFRVPGHFLAMWLGNPQFLENFLGLQGEKLNFYMESRKHFAATDLCYELYLSDLDLELGINEDYWRDLINKKLWKTYNLVELDKDYSLCSTNLIHYGSTYYSSLWSKMLAADCYRAFVESTEVKDVAVDGARFRTSFFESPHGSPPSEIFRFFRGRDPSPDAFLWSLGLMKLDKKD